VHRPRGCEHAFVDLLKHWALNTLPTRCPPGTRASLVPHKKAPFPQSNHPPPPPPQLPLLTPSPPVTHHTLTITMNNSSYTNKNGVASSTWPDPRWATGAYPYYPNPSVPQSIHPDLTSAPGYTSNAEWPESYVPDFDFNAKNVSAFSPAPTLANLKTEEEFTNPVSVNILERRHGLTLLCHRMLMILGSCCPCVRSLLASATILRIHQIRTQSQLQCKICGFPAATGWQPALARDRSHCHRLGGCNT
jgi:hypothetical protein